MKQLSKIITKIITKTQIITIILLITYAIWEFYVYKWAKTLPEGDPVIRVDLIMIYPVLVILIVISLVQMVKNRNKIK